jgi:hypothetical protein
LLYEGNGRGLWFPESEDVVPRGRGRLKAHKNDVRLLEVRLAGIIYPAAHQVLTRIHEAFLFVSAQDLMATERTIKCEFVGMGVKCDSRHGSVSS